MLNDVRFPPLEPRKPPQTAPHASADATKRHSNPHPRVGGHSPVDRAHELDRAGHRAGVDLIYPEPEDRGDSFNTTLSAIIVAVVLLTVLGTVWAMWT